MAGILSTQQSGPPPYYIARRRLWAVRLALANAVLILKLVGIRSSMLRPAADTHKHRHRLILTILTLNTIEKISCDLALCIP